MPFAMIAWKFLKSRPGIGLVAALVLGLMWVRGTHYRNQRDDLRTWKAEVVTAARAAAHRPMLAEDQVAIQISNLGLSLDRVVAAQQAARAMALAAKAEQERRDRENKRKHDDVLPGQLADARRRADAYFDRNRLRGEGHPTAGSGTQLPDLPSPAFGPQKPDGPGADDELVTITRSDLNTCTTNTAKLHDARQWAIDAGLIKDRLPPISP